MLTNINLLVSQQSLHQWRRWYEVNSLINDIKTRLWFTAVYTRWGSTICVVKRENYLLWDRQTEVIICLDIGGPDDMQIMQRSPPCAPQTPHTLTADAGFCKLHLSMQTVNRCEELHTRRQSLLIPHGAEQPSHTVILFTVSGLSVCPLTFIRPPLINITFVSYES